MLPQRARDGCGTVSDVDTETWYGCSKFELELESLSRWTLGAVAAKVPTELADGRESDAGLRPEEEGVRRLAEYGFGMVNGMMKVF